MKILMVCKSLPIRLQGGIQTHVWKLSEHLIRLGHDVSILAVGSWKQGEKRYTIDGRNIIEIPYLPLYWQPILPILLEEWSFNMSAKRWLKRHEADFDIIHLQGRSGFLFPRPNHKTPIVSTFHGLVTVENKYSMKPRTTQMALHEKWASFFEKKTIQFSDAIIAVSHEMLHEMDNLMSKKVEKAEIIFNGVDSRRHIIPMLPKDKTEAHTLVFIGRLDPIKGIYNLAKAMKKVNPAIQLVMIGDSYERPIFEKFVDTEGVADRLKILGALPNDKVLEWIEKSYAVVMPSFHETQGIVLLEANACGKPVVASNVCGIRDVVKQGYNGLMFDPNDVDSISEAINSLFKIPEKALEMGENGRKMVEKYYAWDKIVVQTIDLYYKTVAEFHSTKTLKSQTVTDEALNLSQVG